MRGPLRFFSEPRLSDHALLRFIERVLGVDLDQLRERLLSPAIVEAIKAGATEIIAGEVTFVVDGVIIVTTLGPGQLPTRPSRGRPSCIISIDDDSLRQTIEEYRRAMGEVA